MFIFFENGSRNFFIVVLSGLLLGSGTGLVDNERIAYSNLAQPSSASPPGGERWHRLRHRRLQGSDHNSNVSKTPSKTNFMPSSRMRELTDERLRGEPSNTDAIRSRYQGTADGKQSSSSLDFSLPQNSINSSKRRAIRTMSAAEEQYQQKNMNESLNKSDGEVEEMGGIPAGFFFEPQTPVGGGGNLFVGGGENIITGGDLYGRGSSLSGLVVNGKNAPPEKSKYMASLFLKGTDSTSWSCGGTLVARNVILTSAHCLDYEVSTGKGTVYVGGYADHGREGNGVEVFDIKERALHPQFSRTTDNYPDRDVALVKLDGCVSNSKAPIQLNDGSTVDVSDGDQVAVLGWGDTAYKGKAANVLQMAYTNIDEDCYPWNTYGTVTKNMICTLDQNGPSSGPCNGDSGGPAIVEKNGVDVQLGVVSFSYECADSQQSASSVYANVAALNGWIQNKIQLMSRGC